MLSHKNPSNLTRFRLLQIFPVLLSVLIAVAACGGDPSSLSSQAGVMTAETVDVRRRLFELAPTVPLIIEALVAGEG